TCIQKLQKKIVVLEEDVWDRCKRLDLELDEKSKTAVQVQISISLLNNRLSEEQVQKMEYKTSSESAMESMKSVIAKTDSIKEELREHIVSLNNYFSCNTLLTFASRLHSQL
ncbi:hypothetical protein H0H87_002799, partial [Tephrocybe sp. NHM501043]